MIWECGVGNLDVGSDSYSGLGREKTIPIKAQTGNWIWSVVWEIYQ